MNKTFRLTKDGISELKEELDSLIAKRGDVAEAIKNARELGDLSENAEYQSARSEQERVESRISEIEAILLNAEVIKKPKADNKVSLGSVVKLRHGSDNKQFQIVGTVEADPLNGKISDESPIGAALLNKKVNDSVDIKTSSDTVSYKIIEIS
jgi:transcription elongation factor GreA